MEIWKVIDWIEGIPPIYAVSNYGNVKTIEHFRQGKTPDSFARFSGRIKKQQTDNDGYKRVMLYGKSPYKKFIPVHRLVATAFIPNINKHPQINHKDENKSNNKADNLEWCTCEYNNNYGFRNERVAKAKKGIKRPYMERDSSGRFIGSRKEK